jgi:hypothetical protein
MTETTYDCMFKPSICPSNLHIVTNKNNVYCYRESKYVSSDLYPVA